MALPDPVTRKEHYLAKAAGKSVPIPETPITREEAYLDKIARSGGGSGGTTDYDDLDNLPKINGHTLIGNKTSEDLGLVGSIAGKGLSTNDYTDADQEKLGDLADIKSVGAGLNLNAQTGELTASGVTVDGHGIIL